MRSFREVVETLTDLYGKKIAPFYQPIRENEKFVGFVNVVKMAGRRFTTNSDYVECEIPEYNKANLQLCRDTLMEAVAETSEEMMERYFSGETFSEAEIRGGNAHQCLRWKHRAHDHGLQRALPGYLHTP